MEKIKLILLLEDDSIIAYGLIYALELEGYTVIHSANVCDALSTISINNFDLAILDVQLPDGTGFDISKQLKDTNTAIIFLTIVDDESNTIHAFESGADDYITKPFRLRELLARVKRTLNIHSDINQSTLLSIGQAEIDTTSGKVFVDGELIELSALEYRLLLTFASNKSQLLTRTQILEGIWDSAGSFVEDNTLTVYIKRLREKLGDAVNIKTIRGIGYRVD